MPRILPDWLTAWEEYFSDSPCPTLFRRWSGISLLAGAMERKCWVKSLKKTLYPNLYVILVAPPGGGKSFLIEVVREFWSNIGEHHIAPDSVSRASLADALKDAERHIVKVGEKTYSFNSLLIASSELGNLITSYDGEFMSFLNHLYDCPPYKERKRGKGIEYELENAQLNLLAGTQPAYLNNLLPEGAWQQGFMSRTIIVYSGEVIYGDLNLYEEPDNISPKSMDDKEKSDLMHDLKIIGNTFKKFTWTKESASIMQRWYETGGEPAPDHPKLLGYCARRGAHLIKLCQVASISDCDDMVITIEHFKLALDWMIEVEYYMPDIFKAMSYGGDGQLMKDCWHFFYKIYVKKQEPIRQARLISFLKDRTTGHNVERLLNLMVMSDMFKEIEVNKVGKCYAPKLLMKE